jgi:hypothetical protein
MDTKKYQLYAQIQLTPRCSSTAPEVIVSFNHNIIYAGSLSKTTTFDIDQNLDPGEYQLSVEFLNKLDSDTDIVNGVDKAVIIDQIIFNNIQSPKFVWAGVYRPVYPESWASQQQNLEPLLKSHNYLGWNGKWTLTFSVPIFTWIHRTENLGWIYN